MGLRALSILLLILATQAHAAERPLYDAGETIRRAQVGTYSPRLAPPVRVSLGKSARFRTSAHKTRQIQQEFERMDCRVREPSGAIVCVGFPSEKVNIPKKSS